jgi:hypothetical protein
MLNLYNNLYNVLYEDCLDKGFSKFPVEELLRIAEVLDKTIEKKIGDEEC